MLVILSLLVFRIYSQCPSVCNCESRTLSCMICITSYLQHFNLTTNQCQCMPGFRHLIVGGDYCCPLTCQVCSERGCATCSRNAKLSYNTTLRFYDCVCNDNYYLSGSKCFCNSNILPTRYFSDPSDDSSCYRCPTNCICSQKGCISCQPQTNRTVQQIQQQRYICPCNGNLFDLNGTCVCYDKCICENNEIKSCEGSNRDANVANYPCIYPYVALDNKCVCDQNYYQDQTFGTKCLCKSKIDYTQYYQANGNCYKCLQSCTCDNQGCKSCTSSLVQFEYSVYFCAVGAADVDNLCVCIEPYFYNESTKTCTCMSIKKPQKYYIIMETRDQISYYKVCYPCPKNCTCSAQKGCYQCDPSTLRQINDSDHFSNNQYYKCLCQQNAEQNAFQCVCKQNYYYDQSSHSCLCANQLRPSLIFVYNEECIPCPLYCNCSVKGCHQCFGFALRQIVQIHNQMFYICPCLSNLVQLQQGKICGCNNDSFYNPTSKSCQCLENYFTNTSDGSCVCKSQIDSQNYYVDHVTNVCYACPFGCLCDYSGCYDCDPLSMRFIKEIVTDSDKNNKSCPCFQNTYNVNGICTICKNVNEYYDGVGCTQCLSCLTCNKLGCTSCKSDMELINQTICVCKNSNLTNINGHCICPSGQYYDQNQIQQNNQTHYQCLLCPLYCSTCVMINSGIQCTACNITGTHRKNIIQNNCPCQNNYTEPTPVSKFCCPVLCNDCNQTHCLSCPKYSFRTLTQGKCLCIYPHQQVEGALVCKCSENTYYINQTCIQCSPKCKGCHYNNTQSTTVCSSCVPNSNRNITSQACPCLSGFIESFPLKWFCYDRYCKNKQQKCTKCLENMILNNSNLCGCPLKYYQVDSDCFPCSVQGCLKCRSKNSCQWCDQQNGYYFVDTICLKITTDQFILSQASEEIIMQIKLDKTANIVFQRASASIFKIKSPNSTKSSPPYSSLLKSLFGNDTQQGTVVTAILENPKQSLQNVIISILMTNSEDNSSSFSINIKADRVFSDRVLSQLDSTLFKSVWTAIMLCVIVALIINIKGYKHNQIVFYMQTLSFLCYYIQGATFQTVQFLYNMRASYFKFANGPFSKLIPSYYMESSSGNFRWLTLDSNIIRLIDLTILFCCVLLFTFLILQLIYLCVIDKYNLDTKFISSKKFAYRAFQFFFKSFMYPIIFFSFNTILNYDCKVYLNHNFKYFSLAISVLLIVLHAGFVAFIYGYAQMSRLYKIQMVIELLIDYCASISLIKALNSKIFWVSIFIIILIAKDLSYYFLRKVFSKERDWILYLQLIVIPVQIIPLFMIYFDFSIVMIVSIGISLIMQAAVQIIIVQRINSIAEFDKLKLKVTQQSDSSNTILQ